MLKEKKIQGIVYDKVFDGLESVPAGLKALGERETWGKAVVTVKHVDSKI